MSAQTHQNRCEKEIGCFVGGFENSRVAAANEFLHAGFARVLKAFREENITERGRDGERHGEGGEDREDVTDGERREEIALQA
jgi:hypothetical protein